MNEYDKGQVQEKAWHLWVTFLFGLTQNHIAVALFITVRTTKTRLPSVGGGHSLDCRKPTQIGQGRQKMADLNFRSQDMALWHCLEK
jgi:hypothetical protein